MILLRVNDCLILVNIIEFLVIKESFFNFFLGKYELEEIFIENFLDFYDYVYVNKFVFMD